MSQERICKPWLTKNMHSEEGKADNAEPQKSIMAEVEVDKGQDDWEMTPEALQELIMERKVDRKRKAEEKRQEGLRRIVEMKSRHGIHPIEDLFPEEIWIKILKDKDLSPRDRYNMRQVHPVFHDLMKSTEIQDILFPLALDLKIPFLEGSITSESDYPWKRIQQILALRRVSKGIRDSVDNYMEEHLLYCTRNSRPLRFFGEELELGRYSRDEPNMIRKISAFTSGPIVERARRFFLRSLHVRFFYQRAYEENLQEHRQRFPALFQSFKMCVTELLEKVGDQILDFQMSFDGMGGIVDDGGVPLPQVAYGIIHTWLRLMPNLKFLAFWISPQYSRITPYLPMPKLNALEGVYFFQPTSPTMEAILLANPHVKYLMEKQRFGKFIPYSIPTVLRLPLEAVKCSFPSLARITESNWNIKRMALLARDVSLDEVFQHLQQNFPALEQLSLKINNVAIGKELNLLRLPNLKHFELEFGRVWDFSADIHFFFALHFLLKCAKLESLKWTNLMNEADLIKIGLDLLGREQSQRLIGFQGEGGMMRMDMRRSNVWDVFPKLRCIMVKFRHYWYSINERRGSLILHCPEWNANASMNWDEDFDTDGPDWEENLD